jgi:hypothetical protein
VTIDRGFDRRTLASERLSGVSPKRTVTRTKAVKAIFPWAKERIVLAKGT